MAENEEAHIIYAEPEPLVAAETPKPFHKVFIFVEHAAFWGGVGVVVGAAAVTVNMKILYFAGWICFVIAILRTNFFEGKGRILVVFGNVVLCALFAALLFESWKFTPKPKDPPTAQENAAAVVALEEQHAKQEAQATPPSLPAQPNIPPTKHTKPVLPPKTPPQEPPSSPVVARLTVTQTSDVSSRSDAPNLIRAVVQSTVEFPRLRLAVQCDGPIVDGSGGVNGEMKMSRQGVVNGHPNVFILSYEAATPPFGPASPITVNLWSKEPIHCSEAATF